MDNNNNPSGFGGFRLIFFALLAGLVIAGLMMGQSGNVPDWEKCKESLFQQMFSDQCTPRRGFEQPELPSANTGGENV